MTNDTDYKKQYEDLQQLFSETLESCSAAKAQLRRQRTTTLLVGMGAVVFGAVAGYVAGVLRLGR